MFCGWFDLTDCFGVLVGGGLGYVGFDLRCGLVFRCLLAMCGWGFTGLFWLMRLLVLSFVIML